MRSEIIKSGGDSEVDWIWKLCNMTFEGDVVLKIGDLL